MNKDFNSIEFEDDTFGYYHLHSVNTTNLPVLILTKNTYELKDSEDIQQLSKKHDVYLTDLQTTPKNKRWLIDPPLTTYALRIKKLIEDLHLTEVVVISSLEYGTYVLEFLKTSPKVVKHFIGINTPLSAQSYTEGFSAPIKRMLNASMRQANISMGAGSICYQINDCERILFTEKVDVDDLQAVTSKIDLIVNYDIITKSTTDTLLNTFKESHLTQTKSSNENELLRIALSLI